MLVIEENILRLAKMQETLLKVSKTNKEENLEKYIKTVTEIDTQVFENIIDKAKNIDEHNQTLEEELEYLKEFNGLYNELVELQNGFKDICKKYGNFNLQLSDLSNLNIEYVTSRIKAIDEYLKNLENIETNKTKIQNLNEQLIVEEKKKATLDKKLDELETSLIEGFGSIEGRAIVDGKLEYTNISIEYSKISFDFGRLISDNEYLNSSLAYVRKEKNEIAEKVKVAEVCYSSMPTADSKQILDEINAEYLKIKYKLTMLEIIELLLKKCDNYDDFINKRRNIIDLIKYRLVCMESLGIKSSIDPFGRLRIKEQLEMVQSLTDNSKIISNMMKEISRLNSWTEEMIFQNNGHLITISATDKLIEDKVSLNDIDITPTVSFDELLIRQKAEDNQVVKVRSIGSNLNMNIIGQKTSSVIKRVNEMINGRNVPEEIAKEITKDEIIPELVIVPVTTLEVKEEEVPSSIVEGAKEDEVTVSDDELIKTEDVLSVEEIPLIDSKSTTNVVIDNSMVDIFNRNDSLFEDITPFEEPSLFAERMDETVDNVESTQLEQIELISPSNNEDTAMIDDFADSMPDVFWVSQSDQTEGLEEDTKILSFDEQINALLSYENNDKVKKKVV